MFRNISFELKYKHLEEERENVTGSTFFYRRPGTAFPAYLDHPSGLVEISFPWLNRVMSCQRQTGQPQSALLPWQTVRSPPDYSLDLSLLCLDTHAEGDIILDIRLSEPPSLELATFAPVSRTKTRRLALSWACLPFPLSLISWGQGALCHRSRPSPLSEAPTPAFPIQEGPQASLTANPLHHLGLIRAQ